MPYKEKWGEKAKQRSKKRTRYFIEYRNRFPEKKKARQIVNYLIKRGVLKKDKCNLIDSFCHGRIEAHHKDYSKPLEIIWLCSLHHRIEHTKLKKKYTGVIIKCKHCNKTIEPPKLHFCSSNCNLAYWRKNGKVKI